VAGYGNRELSGKRKLAPLSGRSSNAWRARCSRSNGAEASADGNLPSDQRLVDGGYPVQAPRVIVEYANSGIPLMRELWLEGLGPLEAYHPQARQGGPGWQLRRPSSGPATISSPSVSSWCSQRQVPGAQHDAIPGLDRLAPGRRLPGARSAHRQTARPVLLSIGRLLPLSLAASERWRTRASAPGRSRARYAARPPCCRPPSQFEVRASEIASPRPGDQLAVGGDTFIIQGELERRDPDRLVWSLDTRLA
jgi:hypothetical protein